MHSEVAGGVLIACQQMVGTLAAAIRENMSVSDKDHPRRF